MFWAVTELVWLIVPDVVKFPPAVDPIDRPVPAVTLVTVPVFDVLLFQVYF